MKTLDYNPSLLEVEFVKILVRLKDELSSGLSTNNVQEITTKQGDNPSLIIKTMDEDGDHHEIVIKVIQKPDRF
ncbi:MAG: hypothetical protein IIB82_06490 [Bacteroidetes bacterium]|nr:hypothetical protein [Bacteroidota bacterium]